MIEQILFVVSAVCVFMYLLKVTSIISGNTITTHIPILSLFSNVTFGNSYVYTFSLTYQIYFWSNYAGIFNQ